MSEAAMTYNEALGHDPEELKIGRRGAPGVADLSPYSLVQCDRCGELTLKMAVAFWYFVSCRKCLRRHK